MAEKNEIIEWDVSAVLGWISIAIALVALVPAIVFYSNYYIWGGISGLFFAGFLLIGKSGPVRAVYKLK